MAWYHEVLLSMAAVAAILAWRVPWAVTIIGTGTLMAMFTSFWHMADLPYGVLVGATTNLMMCAGLACIHNSSRMIDRIFSCYILMILIDLLFVVRVIETQYIFAVSLEVVNAYALLLVWAAGITERLGRGRHFGNPYRGLLGYFNRALLAESKAYPRWWRHP